jgi:hypothetical protein
MAMNCISDNPISADSFDVEETGSISEHPFVASGIVSSSSSSYSDSIFVPSSDESVDSEAGFGMVEIYGWSFLDP